MVLAGRGAQSGSQEQQRGLSGMHHYFQISSFLLTYSKLCPIQRNNVHGGDTSSTAFSPFVKSAPDPFFFFFFPFHLFLKKEYFGIEMKPEDLCDRVD